MSGSSPAAASREGVRSLVMRGGTSKGVYLLADDVPTETTARDDLLLRLLGSPDERQIDGLGGAHPLTSKVAIVGPSSRADADVDYLFCQVFVDEPRVSTAQNCGNLLAGVGPFAIERSLVAAAQETTAVRIHMVNSGELATATIRTPGGRVAYDGDTAIAGVPGTSAPVIIDFPPGADSTLFPTGRLIDRLEGVDVTCVDDGMPVVVVAAESLGVTGQESCAVLEADERLREHVERLRIAAGHAMGLGDVSGSSIPKMSLVSAPRAGGVVSTRTFIPHRCHAAIGVLGAASVAAACAVPGTVTDQVAASSGPRHRIEHPSGHLDVEVEVRCEAGSWIATRTAVVRTARALLDGIAYPGPARA